MNDTEMQAENELVAELQDMARTVRMGVQMGDSPPVWKQHREQIAALRQRVRTMRNRHLGTADPGLRHR
jgi:hypothetical protein